MTNPENYGRFYWCAKVNASAAPSGEIYVYADSVNVVCGALVFTRHSEHGRNLIIAPGLWRAVYAASCLDGAAVAVEHWEGEVQR